MDEASENPVRRRLRESLPVLGCTITSTSLELAARAARAGFHFLWLELEHSPVTLETVRHVVLATRGLPAVPFARVPATETWLAKRVLDAGVHGVIFPIRQHAGARPHGGGRMPVSAGRPAWLGCESRPHDLART